MNSIISDSSDIDLDRAVRRNRHHGEALGWHQEQDRIEQLLGFTNMSPDEELFAEAVAAWQETQGLDVDGIIGPDTWREMKGHEFLAISDSSDIDLNRAVRRNRHHGEALGWLQEQDRIEQLLGFTNMSPDEELFAEAVADWQWYQNLAVDGIIGPGTWGKMKVTLAEFNANVPTVWPTRPLPPSESERFVTALNKLEELVKASSDPRKSRYECWITMLKKDNMDDRVIEWRRICPSTSGAIGAAFVVGPCELSGLRPKQEEIENGIQSVQDVDTLGHSVGIYTYLKSYIVFSEEMTALPLENLRMLHDEVQKSVEKLNEWANAPLGGSSAMPKAYVSIKDWIGLRQGDLSSSYNCK